MSGKVEQLKDEVCPSLFFPQQFPPAKSADSYSQGSRWQVVGAGAIAGLVSRYASVLPVTIRRYSTYYRASGHLN